MAYLAIINGEVKAFFDRQAMADEGVTPVREITNEEYDFAQGQFWIDDNGEIIAGPSPAEIEKGERVMRINDAKVELAEIDREAGAGRTIRAIALEAGKKAGMKADPEDPDYNEDYAKLCGQETRAEMLRERIREMKSGGE
jgi:hypothetical protein